MRAWLKIHDDCTAFCLISSHFQRIYFGMSFPASFMTPESGDISVFIEHNSSDKRIRRNKSLGLFRQSYAFFHQFLVIVLHFTLLKNCSVIICEYFPPSAAESRIFECCSLSSATPMIPSMCFIGRFVTSALYFT